MFDELGLVGWLFVGLGWIVAGLGFAWLFGGVARAGRAERKSGDIPSAVGLYAAGTDRDEERVPSQGAFNHPAKL